MAAPVARAAASPSGTMASLPSITFIATALANPMLAGRDRSTLPGPSVMTNIWPIPTMTMKTASESAAVIIPPAPYPPVKAMAASHTASAPRNDQIQGRARMPVARVIASGLLPAEKGAGSQHDDEDCSVGADLPVRRNAHERQKRRGGKRQGERAEHRTNRRDPPADKLAAAQDHPGDGEKGVAIADIGIRRCGGADQCQARSDAEETGEREQRHLCLEQRPSGTAYRQ